MTTFVCGILGLVLGGLAYGLLCAKIMKPDDRKTPAYTAEDGHGKQH
jgi:carbon starvation protein CstA